MSESISYRVDYRQDGGGWWTFTTAVDLDRAEAAADRIEIHETRIVEVTTVTTERVLPIANPLGIGCVQCTPSDPCERCIEQIRAEARSSGSSIVRPFDPTSQGA